jgi:hypothetical protein
LKSEKIELKLPIKSYFLFSKSGFTDALIGLYEKREDVVLIDSLLRDSSQT